MTCRNDGTWRCSRAEFSPAVGFAVLDNGGRDQGATKPGSAQLVTKSGATGHGSRCSTTRRSCRIHPLLLNWTCKRPLISCCLSDVAMDSSRPSSPDALPQDLWSSILDSVSTSRSIPAKHVLVLGQPSSGKSALVSALLEKSQSDAEGEGLRADFALGYDWADVRDDADEGKCSHFIQVAA